MAPHDTKAEILYAQPDDAMLVVRVVGRGNFDLSPRLKALVEKFGRADAPRHYVFDMEACPSLDSTFMGVMAAMALQQMARLKQRMVVLNTNPVTESQMEKLGLKYLLDIHTAPDCPRAGALDFRPAEAADQDRVERVVHMLESHQALIDAHSGNAVEFQSVMESLNASLNRLDPSK